MTIRKRIKKWLYNSCPGLSGSFPYFGTKVYFPKNSEMFNIACDQGIFENENLRLILKLVEKDSYYIDVGSNIGLMSIPILHYIESCNVLSFEPSPNSYPYLERTLNRSKYKERWKIINKAVSDEIGQRSFFLYDPEFSVYEGFKETIRIKKNYTNTVSVSTNTLDYEWKNLGYPNVSCIKIDVEGAELKVLRGSIELINENKPSLLVEWNIENIKAFDYPPEALSSFCDEIDYGLYLIPELFRMESAAHLKLHMINCENYLLLPN